MDTIFKYSVLSSRYDSYDFTAENDSSLEYLAECAANHYFYSICGGLGVLNFPIKIRLHRAYDYGVMFIGEAKVSIEDRPSFIVDITNYCDRERIK
jgi:hypothetical protein